MLTVVVLTAVGCGSDGDHGGHQDAAERQPPDTMGHRGAVPGEPADPLEADRKVNIVASDDLSFDPASIEVSVGEVITFVVRNTGSAEHEFVLGDETYQEMHAQEMAEGGDHMMGMDNALVVGPGETAELTWRFSDPGVVLFGCHEPGHYDGGMVGTVEVH